MASFRYRALVAATGQIKTGTMDGTSRDSVFAALRRDGLMPMDAVEMKPAQPGAAAKAGRISAAQRKALPHAMGELSVLLGAGLPLDRALSIVVDHIPHAGLKAAFAQVRERVKSGMPLSAALAEAPNAFPPMATALAEAGEASGKLDLALTRLAETLDRAEALRQTVGSALLYPCILLVVAGGVILVMLLLVVPQFESLLGDMGGKLPFATAMLMTISRLAREWGLIAAAGLAGSAALGLRVLRRPAIRARLDRLLLRLPLLGTVITNAETARLARTLGILVESGVHLPNAMLISARALNNGHMAAAVTSVADGVKEGGGLAQPLAAAGIFPPIALSFLRTGEETAQLGLMLGRLADVLDRDVRTSTQRVMTILTPMITIILGMTVAGIIAALFSAILGINDLAIQS